MKSVELQLKMQRLFLIIMDRIDKIKIFFLKDIFSLYLMQRSREVAEWLKAHAWKVCIPIALESRVRIPSSLLSCFLIYKEIVLK